MCLCHINSYSLNKNFDEFQRLLTCKKTNFNIIGVTKTRIATQVSSLNNLNLNNYSYEFTPTETTTGGILLYIARYLSYRSRYDLNIYEKNELESTFIKTRNPRKSNIIVGIIYRDLSIDLTYFNKLLENVL